MIFFKSLGFILSFLFAFGNSLYIPMHDSWFQRTPQFNFQHPITQQLRQEPSFQLQNYQFRQIPQIIPQQIPQTFSHSLPQPMFQPVPHSNFQNHLFPQLQTRLQSIFQKIPPFPFRQEPQSFQRENFPIEQLKSVTHNEPIPQLGTILNKHDQFVSQQQTQQQLQQNLPFYEFQYDMISDSDVSDQQENKPQQYQVHPSLFVPELNQQLNKHLPEQVNQHKQLRQQQQQQQHQQNQQQIKTTTSTTTFQQQFQPRFQSSDSNKRIFLASLPLDVNSSLSHFRH